MKRSHHLFITIWLVAMATLLGAQETLQIVSVDQLPFSVQMVSDAIVMAS